MSIYNINNLVGKNKIQVLKKYLNTDKITVCYSDWSNVFGIKTYKKDVNRSKHELAVKHITKQLQDTSISVLKSYPKINVNNCKAK